MGVGLYFDARNPEGWRRPWREHYPFILEIASQADALGADCLWLTEHHGFEDGYLSQPLVLAAAVATRTQRCRVGTSVLLGTLRHPVHIAEEAAVVDLISGGRLELGLGAGYIDQDFDLFGADKSSRFASLDSTFDQVRKLLDGDGITPAPVQRPFPVWLGYSQPIGARKAGLRGAGMLGFRRPAAEAYLGGLVEAGHDTSVARLAGGTDIIVADDPESAYARVLPHYLYQLNTYIHAAKRPTLNRQDLGDRLGKGRRAGVLLNVLVLTPDEAVAEVRHRIDGLPVAHVYTWATIANMPEDLAARHRELWLGPVRDALTSPEGN